MTIFMRCQSRESSWGNSSVRSASRRSIGGRSANVGGLDLKEADVLGEQRAVGVEHRAAPLAVGEANLVAHGHTVDLDLLRVAELDLEDVVLGRRVLLRIGSHIVLGLVLPHVRLELLRQLRDICDVIALDRVGVWEALNVSQVVLLVADQRFALLGRELREGKEVVFGDEVRPVVVEVVGELEAVRGDARVERCSQRLHLRVDAGVQEVLEAGGPDAGARIALVVVEVFEGVRVEPKILTFALADLAALVGERLLELLSLVCAKASGQKVVGFGYRHRRLSPENSASLSAGEARGCPQRPTLGLFLYLPDFIHARSTPNATSA